MERPILFINACVRKASRTRQLAEQLLTRLQQPYAEIRLHEMTFPVVNEDFLAQRDRQIAAGEFQSPVFDLARQFAEAETVVIAAPYWDLSFPAALKQYLEQINVVGLTFRYTQEGVPLGLCRAGRLFFVTTAGGNYVPEEFGFGYIRALARNYYDIDDIRLIQAAGLDLEGADTDALVSAAAEAISGMDLD